MKRFALVVTLMFFASMACANDTGYVSPESYAINEADMTDYFDVPAPRKLMNWIMELKQTRSLRRV